MSLVLDALLRESQWSDAIDELAKVETLQPDFDFFPMQAQIMRSIAYSEHALDLKSAEKRKQLEEIANKITEHPG